MTDHLFLIAGAPVITVGVILIAAARFGASRRAVVAELERLEDDESEDIAA